MRVGRWAGSLGVAALVAGVLVAPGVVAGAAVPATVSPIVPRSAQNVTSTPLPTTQIDGVAWAQAVIGNTVYVGGKFANARPAGAAAGTSLTPRANLLAYNLTDGTLVSSFVADTNAQIRAIAVTPDKSKFFVAGDFTTVGGKSHARIAEFTAAGQLVDSWRPSVNIGIKALTATNTTVYAAGMFTVANGNTANHLAAFDIASGNLLNWLPNADNNGTAITVTSDGSKVIAGGNFTSVNGTVVKGLVALDSTTGAVLPWAATNKIVAYGSQASFTSLHTDGNTVYGTAYTGTGTGNLEGTFAADASTGAINWLEDCHGDTYDSSAVNGYVYVVSHAHFCANIGGWEVYSPWQYQRSMAFTASATGTVANNTNVGYPNWGGTPSPSIVAWNPSFTIGSFTGQNQAAWSVKGNADYVVEGGEFPTVNGVAQQGLVRFAVPSISPDKTIPQNAYGSFTPTVTPLSATSARVTIPANVDRDSLTLTYTFNRTANGGKPIYTTTADSTWWNRPGVSFVDTNLTPGQAYWYSVKATDASGNVSSGSTVKITMPAADPSSAYARAVQADGAAQYWRLDAASGNATPSWTSGTSLTSGPGVAHGTAGAITGDPDTADTFNGKNTGYAQTTSSATAPATYSAEAWFKTTSTAGGQLVGFGNTNLPNPSAFYDRTLYVDPAGKVRFFVNPNAGGALTSAASYNDGQWHHAVATMTDTGIALYADGQQVASSAPTTSTRVYPGYWHIGGDTLAGLPGMPASAPNSFFNGSIDEVSIYPTALSAATVSRHYAASGR